MSLNAVGNVNANYVNDYRDSLQKRKKIGGLLMASGASTTLVSTYIKNNGVALVCSLAGGLSALCGLIDSCKADKELKNLNSQQKLNTEI